jgi:hypothetical protein
MAFYQNPYNQGNQAAGDGMGQGQWQAPGQYPPHPQYPAPYQQYQQEEANKGKSEWADLVSSIGSKTVVIILLLLAVFIALYMATAILSTVGFQVEGFGRYATKLHRTLSHRPGSPDWFGGMVQLGLLLWIVYMVISYIKRKGGRQ